MSLAAEELATAPGTSRLRGALRIILYGAMASVGMVLQGGFLLIGAKGPARAFPRMFHRISCRLLGIEVSVRGEICAAQPALFVSNHISYVDIIVLGSLLDASFIAKSDVESWPLFGWLAKLSRTVFVDRRRASTNLQRDLIAKRLDEGERLILFAESTTSDGNRILPFKTSLFSAADHAKGHELPVQPVSIAYTCLDGMPLGRTWRPYMAWYGDMTLGGHLWQLFCFGTWRAEVIFHKPVDRRDFANRKELALHCHTIVADGVSSLLSGRPMQTAPTPDLVAPHKAG
jgi:1-acyl-sn-glycerol-3-phosphate acyltransferase